MQVVHLDLGHPGGCTLAVIDLFCEVFVAFLGCHRDTKQAVITALACDFLRVQDAFGFGHLLKISAQFVDRIAKAFHGTVGLDRGIFVFAERLAGQRYAAKQTVKRVAERRVRDAAFYADVRHQAGCNGNIFNRISQRTGNGSGAFERFAHDTDAGICVRCRSCQNIRKMPCFFRAHLKCAHAVRDDIGHHCKVFARGRSRRKHAVHAGHHLLWIPARHCHIAHCVCGLLRGKLRCCTEFLGLCIQRGNFGCTRTGQCFHI